jgi:AcrR family transcriptional regulator
LIKSNLLFYFALSFFNYTMDSLSKDTSTEEKIKSAARKIFTKNGFAATRTRDIAGEAGINLALLNYYFRSKEKLFNIVMLENFGQFVSGLKAVVNDKKTQLGEKIDAIVELYINQLSENPDLPLFILNEVRSNPKTLKTGGLTKEMLLKSQFMLQLTEELKQNKKTDLNPLHLVINIFSMTIFPFVAAPLILKVANLSNQDFRLMMEERKKLIPQWLKKMLLNK